MMFKRIQGFLQPQDDEAFAVINSLDPNEVVNFEKVKSMRNYKFHKKYFALINFAFEHWQPEKIKDDIVDGIVPKKSFTRFRKDLTILSGYYDQEIRLDGSLRIVAKSISFVNMNEADFHELYSNTIDVILDKILTNYTKEKLDETVRELLVFS